MNKFKTCREILLLSYADNNISDEEFVPLYDCYRSKNPAFGYQSYDVFDLENINSADCRADFLAHLFAELFSEKVPPLS